MSDQSVASLFSLLVMHPEIADEFLIPENRSLIIEKLKDKGYLGQKIEIANYETVRLMLAKGKTISEIAENFLYGNPSSSPERK